MTHTPKVSVIVVTFNGLSYLRTILPQLKRQSYPLVEVIVVDNHSNDGTVKYIQEHFPKYVLICSKENLGFAQANNLGANQATGEYIVLLNNDTSVTKTYVQEIVSTLQDSPHVDVLQTAIVQKKDLDSIDSAGSFWTYSTFLYHFGFGKSKHIALYNQSYPIFSGMGASLVIKKQVIETVGLFDTDFWAYYEETDFCHRAWLAGYQVWYYPIGEVVHLKGGTSVGFASSMVLFHNTKNKVCSYIKNFSIPFLLLVIPIAVVLHLILAVYYMLSGHRKLSLAIMRGLWWNVIHWPQTWKKRSEVQRMRVVADTVFLPKVTRNPRLSYYYKLLSGLETYED